MNKPFSGLSLCIPGVTRNRSSYIWKKLQIGSPVKPFLPCTPASEYSAPYDAASMSPRMRRAETTGEKESNYNSSVCK